MAMTISVGKNVARILDREFPIDTDLNMVKFDRNDCSWSVNSAHLDHHFTPIKEGEVSAEAFRTYGQALNRSIAFNERGKIRKMFDRKEEGVKIVPGHGVFTLPSKMVVLGQGHREIRIRVFGGTEHAAEFKYSNYSHMVDAAAEHYFKHVREITDPVNESLWFPVKYNKENKWFNDVEIPSGISVDNTPGGYRVRYYSSAAGDWAHFGVAKDRYTLAIMMIEAQDQRHKEHLAEAMYRFVKPSFVTLSQYMRSV